ncbi:hypothetical protein [Rhodococcus sp. NPDC060176]|uniref:hypothetical protein n=1 Tax=Rhodococcus sp. NPDC060176 TaxID=3347062 RepID=UPI00365A8CBB
MTQHIYVDRVHARSAGYPGRKPAHRARTNVWLIGDDRKVVIVDPAGAPKLVADAVGKRKLIAVSARTVIVPTFRLRWRSEKGSARRS